MIRRYPPRQKVLQIHHPSLLIGRVFESIPLRKQHIGRPEREIFVLEYGYYDFQNPPYMASRQLKVTRIVAAGTSSSPTTVLSIARLHGYQRQPCGDRCTTGLRAHPLRGPRRYATGGCHLGQGCAWIEKGSSTTCARGFSLAFLFTYPSVGLLMDTCVR
jgi:hypothetical protein